MHLPHAVARVSTEPSRATSRQPAVALVDPVLSFDQVYERHFRFVWRVLRALGVPHTALDDAAQDVFLVVHRKLPEFQGRSDIRTWLFAIARWVVTSERRRLRAKAQHDPIDETIGDTAQGPFELAARNEAAQTIERILEAMSPERRIVFLLMDIEEMKANEVAGLLEVNVNTVYSRLRLAREQLRELLAQQGEQERNTERAQSGQRGAR